VADHVKSFFLSVPMEPVGKARPRLSRKGVYTPKRTKAAEDAIRQTWLAIGQPVLPDRRLGLIIIAYFRRPSSHYNKDGSLSAAGRRAIPGGKIDSDNIAKLVMDALNKLAWSDDRYITRLAVAKAFSCNGIPKIEIYGKALDSAE
jgi:Holliday junction resolvase RusA-like endonuclease